ncbi:DUF1707 domain-containing protein [Nocardioides sp. LHD-245]|uniref:DUF1707 SHOCT-like domain-containing protein n=1 Tax=Nocardioides sp. LHD-245 TaxID=3051387 RepID=UPI0027E10631|nr:DUF1707 domain-containing protein [Nocardioides sp. LHD-245]
MGEHGRWASEDDRMEALSLLESAYGEGRLSRSEWERRGELALRAETREDLTSLTDDLRRGPAREERLTRSRLAVAGAVIALVVTGGVAYTALDHDEPEPAATTAPVVPAPAPEPADEPRVPEPEPPADDVAPADEPAYSFTPDGVRDFAALYQEEFGRQPRALAFGFTDHQAVIYRPSRADGKIRRWFLRDGTFLDDGARTPSAPLEPGLIALAEVDVDAMFRHVNTARDAALGPVDILGVTILRTDGRAAVVVSAGNRSSGSCYRITTTLAGELLTQGEEPCG